MKNVSNFLDRYKTNPRGVQTTIKSNAKNIILFLTFAFLLFAKISYGQTYQVNGNAVNYGSGLVKLTSSTPVPAGSWQTSSAWSTTKQDLTQPFDMSFDMFFGCENGPNGGDGITFTFQNAGINAIGGGGGFLGIGGGPIVSPAISIEFDTYDGTAAGGLNEIPADHIAVDINGNVNGTTNTFIGTSGPTTVQAVAGGRDLEDCATNSNDYYTIRVVWDPVGKTLKLYEEGTLTMTYTNDIVNTIFGGNSSVYWGFTAATGSASNEQWIAPAGTIIPWSCAVNSCCAPFTITPTGPTTVCSSPITLGAASAYSSYSWSNGQTTPTINVSTPGTYTLNVFQNQAGHMCPSTATYVIGTTGPTAALSGGATMCNDATTTPLSVALTGTGPWSLTYAIDGVVQPTITGIASSPYTFPGTAQHTYTLSSVVDNGGCNGLTSGTANVNAYIGLPIGHDNNFTPSGSTTLTVDNGGGTYDWYNSSGTLVYTGTSYNTPTLSATTTYYVQNSALTPFTSKSVAFPNNTAFGPGGNNTQTATGLPQAVLYMTFVPTTNFTLTSVNVDLNITAAPQAAGTTTTVYIKDNGGPATTVTVPVTGLAVGTRSVLVNLNYSVVAGHTYTISYDATNSAQGIMYWDFIGPRGNYPAGVVATVTKDPELTITAPNQGWYPGIFNWMISVGSPAATCGRTPVTAHAVIPAPITLIDFTAKYTGPRTVSLQWSTAAEINNNYFTIQRSTDGVHFTDVKYFPGAGNSTTINMYDAQDNDALDGISYYRIKQPDFDGRYTYSSIGKASSPGAEFSFHLSPNLCNADTEIKITITGAVANQKIPVEILDVLGRKVYSKLLNSDGAGNVFDEISLSGVSLLSGTYVVIVSQDSNKQFRQKLVFLN